VKPLAELRDAQERALGTAGARRHSLKNRPPPRGIPEIESFGRAAARSSWIALPPLDRDSAQEPPTASRSAQVRAQRRLEPRPKPLEGDRED